MFKRLEFLWQFNAQIRAKDVPGHTAEELGDFPRERRLGQARRLKQEAAKLRRQQKPSRPPREG